MKKRFSAIFLTFLMLVCLLSVTAFAAGDEPTVTAVAGLVYDGQFHDLVSTVETDGYTVYYATDTEPLSTKDAGWGTDVPTAREAGTYNVWYHAKDTNGKATEIKSLQVTISPMKLTSDDLKVTVTSTLTYNGKAQKPKPTVNILDKSLTISPSTDYEWDYPDDNVNAGTATVVVKAKAGGNYDFDNVSATFSIKKATVTVKSGNVELTEASRPYEKDNYKADVQFTNSAESITVDGVKIDNNNKERLIIGSVTGTVKFDTAGTSKAVTLTAGNVTGEGKTNPDNYDVLFSDRLALTVSKAEITSYEAPTAKKLVATGLPQQLVNEGSTLDGTMYYRLKGDSNWKSGASAITGTDVGTYVVEYYIKGDSNHQDLGSETPFTVEVTIESAVLGSTISGGNVWIIIAVAVVAVGAVSVLIVRKKKNTKA